jgi:hypothetical protein
MMAVSRIDPGDVTIHMFRKNSRPGSQPGTFFWRIGRKMPPRRIQTIFRIFTHLFLLPSIP